MGFGGLLLAGLGAGLSIAGGVNGMSTAKKQADALKKEASIKANKVAENAVTLAGAQKASFLSSGISIDGSENSTPMAVINKTHKTANEDISQIKENYSTQVESVYSKARTNLLNSFASAAMGFATAGIMGGLDKAAPAAESAFGDLTLDGGMENMFDLNDRYGLDSRLSLPNW